MLTLRCMENWRHDVEDCEKALILVAVMAICGERFTRGVQIEEEFRDLRTILPEDRIPRCNISSIASATGLNRETARRKVNELIEAGMLERCPAGRVSIRPERLDTETTVQILRRQLEAVVGAMNQLIRDGAVRVG